MRTIPRGKAVLLAAALVLQAPQPGLAAEKGKDDTVGGVELDERPPVNVHNSLGGGRLGENQFITSDLIGQTVVSADGKDVGEVADLIIDAQEGRIDTLVVEADSLIGRSYTMFGVDWANVKLERGSDQVDLTITQDEMTTGFKRKEGGEVKD